MDLQEIRLHFLTILLQNNSLPEAMDMAELCTKFVINGTNKVQPTPTLIPPSKPFTSIALSDAVAMQAIATYDSKTGQRLKE